MKRPFIILFSLILWTQLIFTLGLTGWRYKLVLVDNWQVYISPVQPDLPPFAEFVADYCPEDRSIGAVYLENETVAMRRLLFPRPLFAWQTEPLDTSVKRTIQQENISCLLIDDLETAERFADLGETAVYSPNRILIVLP